MSAPECDFSEEYFMALLGPAAMADIDRQVAQAPDPSPELVERVRRILAPTVQRLLAEEAASRRGPGAARAA